MIGNAQKSQKALMLSQVKNRYKDYFAAVYLFANSNGY